MLDPWRLRLLTQLASLGTVRAVAEAARLSPSTVSQQLAVLEREAGAALFERAGRRLRLTPAGVTLARHARVILDQIDAARAEVLSLDGAPTGRVRLGAFTSALTTFVSAAARRLRGSHPRLVVEVRELDPLESLPALLRGAYDVVVTADFVDGSTPIVPNVVHTDLLTDTVVLVTAAQEVHTKQDVHTKAAELADLAGCPWSAELPGTWSHNVLTRACRRAGFEPDIVGTFASYGPLLAHVEAGLSVTLLPELAVDPRYRVRTHPLREPVRRRITAAVRDSSADRPAVQTVVRALQEAAQAHSL